MIDRALDGKPVSRDARWLDPACGEGIFLAEFVRRLAARIPANELPRAVEQQIFGIDIDAAACERARASVVAVVEGISGPQAPGFFRSNVQVADFLGLEPGALEADVIAGNPPYVSATQIAAAEKARFLARFATAWGRLDLYALFIEHGLRFLRPGGVLSYITPDKWLAAESSRRLRSHVARSYKVRSIDRFDRHDLFPGVATVPCVAVVERPEGPHSGNATGATGRWWDLDGNGVPTPVGPSIAVPIGDDGSSWAPATATNRNLAVPLTDLVERISVGIATGLNRCFIVGPDDAKHIEPELLRPIARGRDITSDGIADAQLWMVMPYLFADDGSSPRLVDLKDADGLRAHLAPYREALERRHCVRVWRKAWYDLHDPVTFDLARAPKILLPDVAHTPRFAFDPGRRLPLHSAYYLLPRADRSVDPAELVSILNRPDVATELRSRAPTAKSGYRRFRAQVLRDAWIPVLPTAAPNAA